MSFISKLSHLVGGQLPEFVRAEYPVFVQFVEAYYRFLETDQQAHAILLNSSEWMDIDRTLDVFLPEFRKQYAPTLAEDAIIDIRRLIKLIGGFYEAKGSAQAVETFFRMAFNADASVLYPGQYVLRASDGRWKVRSTLKLDTTAFPSANPFSLAGKKITLRYRQILPVAGDVQTTITINCLDVYKIAPHMFELEVAPFQHTFPTNPLVIGSIAASFGDTDSHIYVQQGAETFGSLSKQVVSVETIEIAGSYFYVGEFSNVMAENSNILTKVLTTSNNVEEDGYFAENYSSEFYNYGAAPRNLLQLDILTSGYRFNRTEQTVDLMVPQKSSLGSAATVVFNLGYLRRDSGTYTSSAGFLSDIYRLQDNRFYQPYSYVIKTPLQQSQWKSLYRSTTHPAGFVFSSQMLFDDTLQFGLTGTSEVASAPFTPPEETLLVTGLFETGMFVSGLFV